MDTDNKCSKFFSSAPCDWGILEFLNHNHSNLTPNQVLARWRTDLEMIRKIGNKEEQTRATGLLRQYKEKGSGSDRHIGHQWLSSKLDLQQKSSDVINGACLTPSVTITNASIQAVGSQPSPTNDVDYPMGDGKAETMGHDAADEPSARTESESGSKYCAIQECEQPRTNNSVLTSLRDAYEKMTLDRKWVLASGVAVEDVIYRACEKMDGKTFANSVAQLFVLDTENPEIRGLFGEDEWNEINAAVLPLPSRDEVLACSLKRFLPVNSTEMLCEVLEKQGYLPEKVSYDPEIHYNSRWADVVLRRFLMLLEADGIPPGEPHLEDWYTSYVWSSILDDCLLNLPGMTVERKESTCRATALRKNRNRQDPTTRMKLGRRFDAIIRTSGAGGREYGAVEAGRTCTGGTKGTKSLRDMFKLTKALRDMLSRLHQVANGEAEVTQRVEVVGVCTAGLALWYFRLGYPGRGYVCWLKREEVVEVPSTINSGLTDLFAVLMAVAQLKEIIRKSAEAVESRQLRKPVAKLYAEIVEGRARGSADCGWAPDSP